VKDDSCAINWCRDDIMSNINLNITQSSTYYLMHSWHIQDKSTFSSMSW